MSASEQEIAELTQAQEALRASERRFRVFVDHAADAFFMTDEQGRVIDVNSRACEARGYTRDELLNMPPYEFLSEYNRAVVEDRVRRILAGVRMFFEGRFGRRDGTVFDVEVRGKAFRDGDRTYIVYLPRDVTSRKRAEEALRASEERFRTLAKATNDAVWDWDLGTNKVWWNEGVLTLFGYRLDNSESDPAWWLDRVHPEDRAAVEAFFYEVVRGKELTWVDEYRFRCADGSYKDVYDRGYVLRDADGRAIRMIGAMLDITDRKRAEEALKKANARIDLAVRSSNLCIWELDMPDGRLETAKLTLINVWEALGYDPRTMPADFSSALALYFQPDEMERVGRKLQELIAGDGCEWNNEFRVRSKDGSTRWHLSRGTVVRTPEGKPLRFIGTTVDITDLKRAEEALRESEQRFRGTFENAAVGIAHMHPNGQHLRVNQKCCDILGYTREELLGKGFRDLIHPDDLAFSQEHLGALMRGDLPAYTSQRRFLRKDGSHVWSQVDVSLQRDAAGNPAYAIGVIQDISERKRLDAELRRAKEAAEAANRAKDEFLANVSHEIRTPMNAILGMTELVLDTPLEQDQRQGLKTVKSAADSLLSLINDLLDFSKIEAGKLELVPADFSLREAVGDTLRALAVRAHKKGLELIYQVAQDVPDALVGDAGRVRQVLLNLVGNAVKFTDEGEVVVGVEILGDSPPPSPGAGDVGLRFIVR